jgi:hypothetical protein
MTWTSSHRRGEVFRTVIATAEARRDGMLPMDVEGVAETFGDELTLLGALLLRWHTRLSGRMERELASQPLDLESAVVAAWRATAEQMPGVRTIIDHHLAHPCDDAMRTALARATAKEHLMLAAMAGRVSLGSAAGPAGVRIGAEIERRARAACPSVPVPERDAGAGARLLGLIRAALAA